MDIEEQLKSQMERQVYSKKTRAIYVLWLKQLAAYFPNIKLEDLSEIQIKEFLSFLLNRKHLTPAAVHQARHALHYIYNSFFPKNYEIKTFPLPNRLRSIPEILSQEEIYSLFSKISDLRLRTILGFIYSAGLDVGEAVKLKLTDIDFQNKFINTRKTQNRSARRMILSDYVASDLDKFIELTQPEKYIFPGKSPNSHFSTDAVQRGFKRALRNAGINKKLTVRCLRYSFIKHLEFQGIPLRNILFEQTAYRPLLLYIYSEIEPSNAVIDHSPLDPIMQGLPDKNSPTEPYISLTRITEINAIKSNKYDLIKLTQICTELNLAHNKNSRFSIALLVRALIDHVPPIFGKRNFSEVANNYSGGQSFANSMKHLDNSLRNVADAHLHVQIRTKEVLPTFNQVDFRTELDSLLGEIIRLLK